MVMISNGNRTEWSPIRSVIIRVITKSDDRAAVIKLSDNNLASELVRNRSFLKPITSEDIVICKIRALIGQLHTSRTCNCTVVCIMPE